MARVTAEWERRTGRPAPIVHPVIVIWGEFTDRVVETPILSYVAGHALRGYLESRD